MEGLGSRNKGETKDEGGSKHEEGTRKDGRTRHEENRFSVKRVNSVQKREGRTRPENSTNTVLHFVQCSFYYRHEYYSTRFTKLKTAGRGKAVT